MSPSVEVLKWACRMKETSQKLTKIISINLLYNKKGLLKGKKKKKEKEKKNKTKTNPTQFFWEHPT